MKRSKMTLMYENRELRKRCSLLAKPELLRDMERTIDQRRKTRARVDALQSTHARIDEQTKSITGRIRAVERRKQSLARY